jgi:hypothetical protein
LSEKGAFTGVSLAAIRGAEEGSFMKALIG